MEEFKIGDRVKVVGVPPSIKVNIIGELGQVTKVFDSEILWVGVVLDSDLDEDDGNPMGITPWYFDIEHLEKL